MGFTVGRKERCPADATLTFKVLSMASSAVSPDPLPSGGHLLHVCSNHGRMGSVLRRMDAAVEQLPTTDFMFSVQALLAVQRPARSKLKACLQKLGMLQTGSDVELHTRLKKWADERPPKPI